ncbi:MAG: Structural maintenance of chromosomes protein 1 [Trizodia sp. TS-e1964]|nr:MAG: Structural maintenance of chromosomes protein 1 [Trizodia sp. TS-e1964]
MGKLIRLELFNFKSYKGHHVLLFGDAFFTSIIGPNGSGKSNSMDAISFVLGIKSSHLRSSHLRDLVYRGRVLRTSTINVDGSASAPGKQSVDDDGDVHMDTDRPHSTPRKSSSDRNDPKSAWVMAVYEDDAADEQRWKRSITNQGSSEYRINDRVVTAQRYNEALESENILIRARNFLVFQGDVEAIASQSPRDLTRLIEQISGSLEYKGEYERLKEVQEQALENQNVKLNRRRGIHSEIKQYREQKIEAENYAKKADERDQAVVTHILWKLFHFQQAIEDSELHTQRYQEELRELNRQVEKYNIALEDVKKEQTRVGRDVGKLEKGIKAKEKEIEVHENQLVPLNEKVEIANKNLKRYTSRIEEIAKERNSQSSSVELLIKNLAIVEKAQDAWELEWRKKGKTEGRELSEADLQEYTKLKEQVNTRTYSNQIKLNNLARQQKTDEETVISLKGKVETTEWQLQKLQEEIKELSERRNSINHQISLTSTDLEGKKKEINTMTSERLRTAQKQTELDEKLQEVLNKLLEADDGRRQSEKEIRIKENVSSMKRIFPGVRGRVSELCKPKQKKFGDAVSTVLGRNFDAVVVDNEKTARDCIQYLRDQRAGQATFIPLDSIQVKPTNSNLKGMHRGMRMALDTIEYDNAVERAMSYACGNAIVCDDLKTAKYLCFDKGVEVKAVTLDGTIIHKGGLMTGGRGPGHGNAKRWEDNEVEGLRRLRDKLLTDLAALPKENRRGAQEETLQADLNNLNQTLNYYLEELRTLERNILSKKSEATFAKKLLKEIMPKYQEEFQGLESLKQNLTEFKDAIEEVEDKIFATFCQRLQYDSIRSYEAQQGSLQQEAAQKKLEFTLQKGKLQNQLSFETQRLQSTKDRINLLEEQSQRDLKLLKDLLAEKQTIQLSLDSLTHQISALKTQLESLNAKYSRKAEKVAEHRHEFQKRSKEVNGTLKAIAGLDAEIQRNAAGRYALLRRCKLEEIRLPLTRDSEPLDKLPEDELLQAEPDEMDIDEGPNTNAIRPLLVPDYGIDIDFEPLDPNLRESSSETMEEELQDKIHTLNSELDKMVPNMRAIERLEAVESRLLNTEKDFEAARKLAKKARDDFQHVKDRRFELFNKAFTHISEQIHGVYRDLTKNESFPLGGQAYLDIEDSDEPYLDGIKYHAMPPLKRFRDMEHLSGGEKTMAALALLFAVHSYQPSPFFVLDEVDAALDNSNVAKIANYIREHAGPGMQFIVISLKTGLFQDSEGLIGIYRDQMLNSSKALTLDVSAPFPMINIIYPSM